MLVKTTFLRNLMLGLAVAVVLVMPATDAFAAYPGARIEDVSCDPGANIANDDLPYATNDGTDGSLAGQFKINERKSCDGQNIDLTNFQVKVSFEPAFPPGLGRDDEWITIGGDSWIHGTRFNVEFEGDLGCVYARPIGTLLFEVTDKAASLHSTTYVNGEEVPVQGGVTAIGAGISRNCVPLPAPRDTLPPPDWGKYVSKTCTRNCDEEVINGQTIRHCASKQRKPFSGMVVQCIEDTMHNLMFLGVDQSTGRTFFANMQVQLRDSVRGLMALYVIFLGLQFIIRKQGVAQADWHWMALKLALVWYFATGTGMIDLMPKLHDLSKGFSLLILEGTFGTQADIDAARADVSTAQQALDNARANLTAARRAGTASPSDMTAVRTAQILFDNAEGQALAFGYDYCDFRGYDYTQYQDIDPASPPGVTNLRTRDMSHMRLWDMVDCKLGKYLGMGDNNANEDIPQVLLIAIASIFSTVFGIIIFMLTLVYLVFVSLIAIRVVHIYLLAFIGLSMMVYISPLIIPAALFNYTKKIFDSWLKQIIAYTVQPMMLFAFLAFVFAIFDHVIYEDNHDFYPMDWGPAYAGGTPDYTTAYPDIDLTTVTGTDLANAQALKEAQAVLDRNKIILDSEGRCPDEDAMGCIYQHISFSSTDDQGFGHSFKFTTVDISYSEGKDIMINLLKLILICFILHAAAGTVESMAARLTNAAGGGAAAMSDTKIADPGKIAGGLGSGAASIAKKPGQVYGAGKRFMQKIGKGKEGKKAGRAAIK